MRGNSRRVVKASGSMMQATAKAPLTGITRPDKSTVEGVRAMQFNREKLFVVVRNRADKIFLVEVGIAGALTAGAAEGRQPLPSGEVEEGSQASLSGEIAIALLVEVIVAVKRGNRAAGVVQAAEAVVREAEDPAVAGLAAVAAVVVAAAEADDKELDKNV